MSVTSNGMAGQSVQTVTAVLKVEQSRSLKSVTGSWREGGCEGGKSDIIGATQIKWQKETLVN